MRHYRQVVGYMLRFCKICPRPYDSGSYFDWQKEVVRVSRFAEKKAYEAFQTTFAEDLSKGRNKDALTTTYFVKVMKKNKKNGLLDDYDHADGTPVLLQNY